MKTLKITKENFDLLASGVKTYELRAYEDLKDGGKFLLTTVKGRTLGIIELYVWLIYCKEEACFVSEMEHKNNHLQNTPFWRPWVNFYLDKGKTPAFYQIVNFEAKKWLKKKMS